MIKQYTLGKNVINDVHTLQALQGITFTKKDVRAAWIGAGIPETKVKDFIDSAAWATGHLNFYLTFLQDMKESKNDVILDVGCGIGHATITLATLYPDARFIAIDYDREVIEFAEKYNSKSILNGCPNDAQATGLRREDIDLGGRVAAHY